MKSAIIAAALCAAFCVSTPAAVQAAATTMAKGPTDVQLYCTFFPWTAKCATPAPAKAKPVAKAVVKPVTKVAMAKPAAAKTGIKTMACVPAPKGKAYLYSCSWK